MFESVDYVVIGGGIAGASIAYWLSPHGKVVVLERESQPGYHSTGRSAALYMASYGGAQVRALTLASRRFFDSPPQGFCSQPLLTPRGAMMIAEPGQEDQLEQHWSVLQSMGTGAIRIGSKKACEMVPVLQPEKIRDALIEPDAADMDVHAIHQGFLRGMTQHQGTVACHAEVTGVERIGADWLVSTTDGRSWRAPVVINAAGAWADQVATLAGASSIGLQPCRRSAFLFAPDPDMAGDFRSWPMTYSASEDWYFKPDAGQLLVSPANADPVMPQDVQPEEIDIATAIYRVEDVTSFRIRRPSHSWAGLRSFVSDGGLVGGFDPLAQGFFWVAAQGGYGIQTSPAMGEACAALARGMPIPTHLSEWGLSAEMLSPERLLTT